MRRILWTPEAADDLEQICDYIANDNRDAARRVAQEIIHRIEMLARFPESGRLGRVEGTRELVFPPIPFIAVYEIEGDVRILRVLHGAQQWPPAKTP